MPSTLLLYRLDELDAAIAASSALVLEHAQRCPSCWLRFGPRCRSGLQLWRDWRIDVDRAAATRRLRRRAAVFRGRGIPPSLSADVLELEWTRGTWAKRLDEPRASARHYRTKPSRRWQAKRRWTR